MIFKTGRRVGQEAMIHALVTRLNQELGARIRFLNSRKEKIKNLQFLYDRLWSPSNDQGISTLEESDLLKRYQDLFFLRCCVNDSHVLSTHREELKELLTKIEPRMVSKEGRLHHWYLEMCKEVLRHEGNASKLKWEKPKQWDEIIYLSAHPETHDGSTIMNVYTCLYTAMTSWIQQELDENAEHKTHIEEFNATFRAFRDELVPEVSMASFLTVVYMDQYNRQQKLDRTIRERFKDLGTDKGKTLTIILNKFYQEVTKKYHEDKKIKSALKDFASFSGFEPRLAPACKVFLTALNDKDLELKDEYYYKTLVAIFTEDPDCIERIAEDKNLPELKEPAKRAIRLLAAAQITAEGAPMEQPSVAERFQLCESLFHDRKLTVPQKKCLAGFANRLVLFANQANPRYFTNIVDKDKGDKRKINQDNGSQSKRIKDDATSNKEDNNSKPKYKNKKNKATFAGDTQTPGQIPPNQNNGQDESTRPPPGNYPPAGNGSTNGHPPGHPTYRPPPYRGRGRGGNGYYKPNPNRGRGRYPPQHWNHQY